MSSNIQSFQELVSRRASISQSFYASFDPSRFWQEYDLAERQSKTWIAGEGRHFRSYRIVGGAGFDFALNVAKQQFLGGSGSLRQPWVQALKKLVALQHPLLPPTEVLQRQGYEDALLLIQPFCEHHLSPTELCSAGIRALLDDLAKTLRKADLVLDDYWQVRSFRGHPFVIDYSELKEIGQSKRLTLQR